MKNTDLKKAVLDLTEGLLVNLSDALLYGIYLTGSACGHSNSSKGIYQTFAEADETFSRFNTRTIIHKLQKLNYSRKYISVNKTSRTGKFTITETGLKHLEKILPFYKTERFWNGKFYFINFDIPEKNRRIRNIIREKLKTVGAGLLQNSLWITPYDPKTAMDPIMDKMPVKSLLVISEVKWDTIAPYKKENLPELIETAFHLEDLNGKYVSYIKNFPKENRMTNIFKYLNILKEDPQLPFELEGKGFKAREAYLLFNTLTPNTP